MHRFIRRAGVFAVAAAAAAGLAFTAASATAAEPAASAGISNVARPGTVGDHVSTNGDPASLAVSKAGASTPTATPDPDPVQTQIVGGHAPSQAYPAGAFAAVTYDAPEHGIENRFTTWCTRPSGCNMEHVIYCFRSGSKCEFLSGDGSRSITRISYESTFWAGGEMCVSYHRVDVVGVVEEVVMWHIAKFGSIAGVVGVVIVLTGVSPIYPAAAVGTSITCVGEETVRYDPPLTFTPKSASIHAEGNYSPCIGGPTSATAMDDGLAPSASCLSISMPQTQSVVKYNTNETDVINYTTTVTTRVAGFNIVTLTGTVVSGPHHGDTAVKTVQLTPIPEPIGCATNGLGVVTGPAQLQIFG